jgi:hypothetical protein
MPDVDCAVCQQSFYAKPNWLKNGHGKYCSRVCAHKAQKTGRMFACHTCKKNTYKSLKDQRRSKSGKFFCNKKCQTIWRNSSVFSGENHANWKGGESSYRQRLLKTELAQICARCSSDDKRILVVHHKDKNRQNNKFSNLIWLCHNCHYLVHHYKDESKTFLVSVVQW